MKIEVSAIIQYHQDPITGFKAYDTLPVEVSATLFISQLGQLRIKFHFPFQHARPNEVIELGITYPFSSNPNIWADLQNYPLSRAIPAKSFEMVIRENKYDRAEAPWARPRAFNLKFFRY